MIPVRGRRPSTGMSPAKSSNVVWTPAPVSSSAASTSATSSRGTGPRRPSSRRDVDQAGARARPVRQPGRTIVQSSELAATRSSASALARRYGRIASPPPLGIVGADRGDDHEARDAPAPRRPRRTSRRAPWSTVRLRSGPEPGPAPAANTMASAPVECAAGSSRSRSQTHGDAAVGLDVGGVVRVADQPAGGVAVGREHADEAAGDLAVSAGDQHVHASQPTASEPHGNCVFEITRIGRAFVRSRTRRSGRRTGRRSADDVEPSSPGARRRRG